MSQLSQNVYCFVSGKNWKLSLGELISYFEARGCQFEVWEFSRSFFTIKTRVPLGERMIDDLGGILKIVEVVGAVPTELVNSAFLKEDKQAKQKLRGLFPLGSLAERIPAASSGKLTFGVSVYWADPTFRAPGTRVQRFLGSALKEELRGQGKKARFMGFPRDRENPQLTPVEVLKQGLIENRAEVLMCMGKQETFIGTTIAVHNPFEFQKRDLDKPVQRKIFGISPRVAKIMVNLTQCTPGKVFLDPFCGVGTLLMEALLVRAKVVGVDINRWCVESAKRNLDWVSREYSVDDADYVVLQGDVRKLASKIGNDVDCIATEPDLRPRTSGGSNDDLCPKNHRKPPAPVRRLPWRIIRDYASQSLLSGGYAFCQDALGQTRDHEYPKHSAEHRLRTCEAFREGCLRERCCWLPSKGFQ